MEIDNGNGTATGPAHQGKDLLYSKSLQGQSDNEPRLSEKDQLATSRLHEQAQLVGGKQNEIGKFKNEIGDKQKQIDELTDEVNKLTSSSIVKGFELRTPRPCNSKCAHYAGLRMQWYFRLAVT